MKRALIKDVAVLIVTTREDERVLPRPKAPLRWIDCPDDCTIEWTYDTAAGVLVPPPPPPGPLPDFRAEALRQLDTLIERARAATIAELINGAVPATKRVTTQQVLDKIAFYAGRL